MIDLKNPKWEDFTISDMPRRELKPGQKVRCGIYRAMPGTPKPKYKQHSTISIPKEIFDGTYRQEYIVLADAIVTNAIVVPMDAEVKAGEQPSRYYYTDSAAWDTGAQFTLISPHVVEALAIKPSGKGQYMGIGGDQESDTYLVHIGLPNGQLKRYVNAYCADLADYDILIDMDIITETDFVITNKDGKTTFQFRSPSEDGVEL